MLYFHILSSFIGIVCGWLMFRKLPHLFLSQDIHLHPLPMTVIIPARNEEINIALLLGDLMKQNTKVNQIIVVDDGSTDKTAEVAKSYGITLLQVIDKPQEWIGKSYACQMGADSASNELLLFLDADVRLTSDALQKVYSSYLKTGNVISVQPFHTVKRWYEQLCLFFNIISVGALGINKNHIATKTSGLFGPLILIPNNVYKKIGGHASIKENILDDISLGEELDKANIAYTCFIGGNTISFRMYRDGIKALAQGFIKNFAAGAMKTSLLSFIFVFAWVSVLFRAPIGIVTTIGNENGMALFVYGTIYVLIVIQLFWISNQLGSFKKIMIILYPICLLFFILILLLSLYKKICKRPVKWKGRTITEKE